MTRTVSAAGRIAVGAALAVGSSAAVLATTAGAAHANTTGAWSATATRAVHLARATKLGALGGSTPLSVTVGLALRNQAALHNFIANTANPRSADFGAVYTPASFRANYGPTATQAAAVASYLRANGLSGISTTSNRLLVTADGTAVQVEKAFHTVIDRYEQGGKVVYANPSAAMVPSSLSGIVVGVLGLNNVFKFSAAPLKATTVVPPLSTPLTPSLPVPSLARSSGPSLSTGVPDYPYEYSPQGFWQAYQAAGQTTGSQTAIATFAEGNLTNPLKNLRIEEAANHLPQVPVTVEQVGLASPDTSGNIEWDLDSQFSTGMAENVSHFYFYDTTSLTDSDLAREFNAFASQDLAKAGSASLGECELFPYIDGSMLIDDEVFAEAAAQGQTMFASAGDTGASCAVVGTNGVPDSGPPVVNYPATSPYVVGVGGTTLLTNSNGSYDAELSWYAGGGGISQTETAAHWQSAVIPVTSTSVTGGRGVPDIAMDADPETGANVYYSGAFGGVGGTSLSAPLALGVWARLESQYANRIGFAAPALYAVYSAGTCQTSASTVEDICSTPALHAPVAGDNGPYPETPGYNYNTGLGTFDVAQMMQAIAPFVPAALKSGPPAPSGHRAHK
ncbi:MAG: S53 family peptidase [Acidimicrobiales bacterium]